MDFKPSDRLTSRLRPAPDQDSLASSLPIPVFVAVKRRKNIRRYARCTFRGFHPPEKSEIRPYMWMGREATVECQFATSTRIQYIWLKVECASPKKSMLDIYVDAQRVARRRPVSGGSTICVKLPEVQVLSAVTLRIESTTFVPEQIMLESDDTRHLGVAISAIVFGKRRLKYGMAPSSKHVFNRGIKRTLKSWFGRRAA